MPELQQAPGSRNAVLRPHSVLVLAPSFELTGLEVLWRWIYGIPALWLHRHSIASHPCRSLTGGTYELAKSWARPRAFERSGRSPYRRSTRSRQQANPRHRSRPSGPAAFGDLVRSDADCRVDRRFGPSAGRPCLRRADSGPPLEAIHFDGAPGHPAGRACGQLLDMVLCDRLGVALRDHLSYRRRRRAKPCPLLRDHHRHHAWSLCPLGRR